MRSHSSSTWSASRYCALPARTHTERHKKLTLGWRFFVLCRFANCLVLLSLCVLLCVTLCCFMQFFYAVLCCFRCMCYFLSLCVALCSFFCRRTLNLRDDLCSRSGEERTVVGKCRHHEAKHERKWVCVQRYAVVQQVTELWGLGQGQSTSLKKVPITRPATQSHLMGSHLVGQLKRT